jgi:type II secretion system protein H
MNTAAPAPRRSGTVGFTLVELLVVVSIMALMLTLSLMSMDSLVPDTRLTSAAREVATLIEDARDTAILEGRVVYIEYSLGEATDDLQHYRSIRQAEPGQERDAEEFEFERVVYDWQALPSGIRIAALMIDEEEEITEGFMSFEVRPDGTVTPHVVQVYCAEIDTWVSVQVNGLLGEANIKTGRVVPTFLSEDTF